MRDPNRVVVVGSLNMDLVIRSERLARAGETITGSDVAFFPGGKGANQACAAASMAGRAWMIGQTGRDGFGEALVARLRAAGVDTTGVGVSDRPTGCALVTVVPSGENSIIVSPGANATVTPEIALERLECLARGDVLLLQLEIPIETVGACLAQARRTGAVTILDPAPAHPLSREVLENVDLLTPNQSETAQLLGQPEMEIRTFAEAEEAACRLLELGPRSVMLKLGRLGCFVACGATRSAVKAFEVPVLDTTAAGDTFNGAFGAALAEGQTLMAAARFANAAAALSVTRAGAQSSVPSRKQVAAFLARASLKEATRVRR